MFPRRIIAVTEDQAFGDELATLLAAPDRAVERHARLADVPAHPAALAVVHLPDVPPAEATRLLAALPPATPVIAIIPRTDLVLLVDVMRAADHVLAVLVFEGLDRAELGGLVTRLLAGERFGLAPFVLPQADLFEVRVGDYEGKSRCIEDVLAHAEATKVRRKYRELIGQCLDEMLMNALYDAPVDAHGKPLFADVPPSERKALPHEHEAVVHYACDGIRFAIAVRDAFGRLERGTLLRYLHKCLHQEQQIDRKAGGAGLGLYLMASSTSSLYFRVDPGRGTEAVCTFELGAPRPRLLQLGFLPASDGSAAAAEPAPPPAPAPAAPPAVVAGAPATPAGPPRALVIGLSAAILIVLGLIGLVAAGVL